MLLMIENCKSLGVIVTGINVKRHTSAVFKLAIMTMRTTNDPSIYFDGFFERPKIEHAQAISKDSLTELIKRINEYNGMRTTVIAIMLLLQTFVRTIELRRAG